MDSIDQRLCQLERSLQRTRRMLAATVIAAVGGVFVGASAKTVDAVGTFKSVTITGKAGETAIRLMSDDHGGVIQIMDEHGKRLTDIHNRPEAGTVELYSDSGARRLQLLAASDCGSVIGLQGDNKVAYGLGYSSDAPNISVFDSSGHVAKSLP